MRHVPQRRRKHAKTGKNVCVEKNTSHRALPAAVRRGDRDGTYAYYKTDLRANGYANVEINLLFDMLDDDALTEYQNRLTANGETLTEADREWGHKGNPYVIRLPRHLQNLSTLQNIGYFEAMFLNSNYADNGALVGNGDYSDGYNVRTFS